MMMMSQHQDSSDWPLPLSTGQREMEEKGRGGRRKEVGRGKKQAVLGGWEEALYPLGM